MVDRNLFLYDLAVVAILKNEGHYLKEWLDYHLLAGVDHFYLYDNDSSDNQAKVAAPYIEAGLVDYIPFPGKVMQYIAYNDAINRFKFQCRYMAFIDLDEFIFPKTNRRIVEVVDEILSGNPNASGLSMHWQIFGSNGQDKADYSRGVLERFTRRAPKDFSYIIKKDDNPSLLYSVGNVFLKVIANPRHVKEAHTHYMIYFDDYFSVNEIGTKLTQNPGSAPIVAEKIAVNHYFTKSREEFDLKHARGRAYSGDTWPEDYFKKHDRNEEFDDSILKYRAERAEKFSLASDEQKLQRARAALIKTLSQFADEEISDLETALICRALSTYLGEKIFVEASLAAILKSLDGLKLSEIQLLLSDLPNLLSLPYPLVADLRRAVLKVISQTMNFMHKQKLWKEFSELDYLRRLLEAWK